MPDSVMAAVLPLQRWHVASACPALSKPSCSSPSALCAAHVWPAEVALDTLPEYEINGNKRAKTLRCAVRGGLRTQAAVRGSRRCRKGALHAGRRAAHAGAADPGPGRRPAPAGRRRGVPSGHGLPARHHQRPRTAHRHGATNTLQGLEASSRLWGGPHCHVGHVLHVQG